MVMRPIVAAVAAEEPEIAAKMPQPKTLQCISLPGSGAIHGARPRNMSSEILVRNRISPIQMKSGSAVSAQLVLAPQIVVAIRLPAGESVKRVIAIQPTPSKVSAIQRPATSSSARAPIRTTDISHISMASALEARRLRRGATSFRRRVGGRTRAQRCDQVVDHGDQEYDQAERHCRLRNPQRHRHQSLRHVVQLVGGQRHVAAVPGEQADKQRRNCEACHLEHAARAAAQMMQRERHSDMLVLAEGPGQPEKGRGGEAEPCEVVERVSGKSKAAADDLRCRQSRDRDQKKSGQQAGSPVQKLERSAHRGCGGAYLWNALRMVPPSAPAFAAHSSAIFFPIASNSDDSLADGFMILMPCDSMVLT